MTAMAAAQEALDAARTNRTQDEIEAAADWLGKAWGVASVFREATEHADTSVLSAAHMLETLRGFLAEAEPVVGDLSPSAAGCIDRTFGVGTVLLKRLQAAIVNDARAHVGDHSPSWAWSGRAMEDELHEALQTVRRLEAAIRGVRRWQELIGIRTPMAAAPR